MKIAQYFLFNFNQIWSSTTDVNKVSNIKFDGNLSSGRRNDTRTDMMKVIGAFR